MSLRLKYFEICGKKVLTNISMQLLHALKIRCFLQSVGHIYIRGLMGADRDYLDAWRYERIYICPIATPLLDCQILPVIISSYLSKKINWVAVCHSPALVYVLCTVLQPLEGNTLVASLIHLFITLHSYKYTNPQI